MHQRRHEMFQSHWISIQQIPQNAVSLSTITPYTHKKHLKKTPSNQNSPRDYINEARHTSLILDFKKGFLIYHVEVKKVRTKVISSTFPDNSNFSGADLLKTL